MVPRKTVLSLLIAASVGFATGGCSLFHRHHHPAKFTRKIEGEPGPMEPQPLPMNPQPMEIHPLPISPQ